MWKNICNISNAVSDLVAIGVKEASYQATKASNATETVTSRLATKAATIKAKYEADLADRKSGVVKPEVVKEAEVPTDVVSVN